MHASASSLPLGTFLWILHLTAAAAMPQGEASSADPLFANPNITFFMYPTPEAADSPLVGDIDVLLPSRPLTMVFHGFKGDQKATSVKALREALMENAVHNVVVVDWGPLADAGNKSALESYHHVSAHGVQVAANLTTEWLRHVLEHKNILPEQVHLIGFSLGAHLVGMVGHMLNATVGRISGLDPPKFGYELIPLERRLDSSDARFVNVIHTSAGILSYPEPIGHVDFFPNGDVMPQVGCPKDSPIHIITCSHYFSFAVFTESVFNKDAFIATECPNWLAFTHGKCNEHNTARMGYSTPKTTRGVFFIKTHDKPPYGVEDPVNPLPDDMKSLLTYKEGDSIVKPSDVVNFLMSKEPSERSSGPEDMIFEIGNISPDDTKVMRVKSVKHPTTTEAPPAFLNSSPRETFSLVVIALISFNLLRQL